MPAKAQPRKPEEVVATPLQIAGRQEDHAEEAVALAASIGWEGEPDWTANDITVKDAQGFLLKTLHEAFQAGAFGTEAPSTQSVHEHLALEDDAEKQLVSDACAAAYAAGKSKGEVKSVAQKTASAQAELVVKMGVG